MSSNLISVSKSQGLVLDMIRRQPGTTRTRMQNQLGLPQQSLHRLTTQLEEQGLIRQSGPATEGRGKPTPPFQLNPAGAFAFGLSINAASAELVLTDLTGAVLAEETLRSDPDDPPAVIAETARLSAMLISRQRLDLARHAGLGVAMQGFRAAGQDQFRTIVQLDRWYDMPIRAAFAQALGPLVYAENNAKLGAIAEAWTGHGQRFPTFAYVSLNYGLGGGFMVEGNLSFGAHWNAGELTTLFNLDQKPHRPALGNLLRYLREHGHEVASIKAIPRRGTPGWDLVEAWVEEVHPALHQLTRALWGILDPAAIIIGGEAHDDLRSLIAAHCPFEIRDRLGNPMRGPLCLPGAVRGDPSACGAAIFAIRNTLYGTQG